MAQRRQATIKVALKNDRPKPTVSAMANKGRTTGMGMNEKMMKMKDQNNMRKLMKLR